VYTHKGDQKMSYQSIVYEIRGQTAWIYLNRPQELNSINSKLAVEFKDAVVKAESDNTVRVIVISGKGKAFCAGADLKDFLSGMESERPVETDFLDMVIDAFNHVRKCPKPVIAALNGTTLAGGLELTMCCDIVFAAEHAKMGDAHSNYCVFPGAGGAAVLPRIIGLHRAKHLLFTGDFISATEMKAYGLVNEVVPGDNLETAVQELADKLSEKSPMVLRRMKEVANQSLDQSRDSALRHELVHLRQHMRSHDMQEGLQAFSEKRKPQFR
jgi:enoyl-CoA hydratase/carnithine racemase